MAEGKSRFSHPCDIQLIISPALGNAGGYIPGAHLLASEKLSPQKGREQKKKPPGVDLWPPCVHTQHIHKHKQSTTSSCQRQSTVLVNLSPLRIWKARFLYCQQFRKTRQQDLNEVFCPALVFEFIWSTQVAAIETSGNFAFLEMFRRLPCPHTYSPLHTSTHVLHGNDTHFLYCCSFAFQPSSSHQLRYQL